VIPVFGYKNHLAIDRHFGFIRTFVVTDAAAHDGRQLSKLLDAENTARSVWADSVYRSAANLALADAPRAGAAVPKAEAAWPAAADPRQAESSECAAALVRSPVGLPGTPPPGI
jgi:IS5 family transposase